MTGLVLCPRYGNLPEHACLRRQVERRETAAPGRTTAAEPCARTLRRRAAAAAAAGTPLARPAPAPGPLVYPDCQGCGLGAAVRLSSRLASRSCPVCGSGVVAHQNLLADTPCPTCTARLAERTVAPYRRSRPPETVAPWLPGAPDPELVPPSRAPALPPAPSTPVAAPPPPAVPEAPDMPKLPPKKCCGSRGPRHRAGCAQDPAAKASPRPASARKAASPSRSPSLPPPASAPLARPLPDLSVAELLDLRALVQAELANRRTQLQAALAALEAA